MNPSSFSLARRLLQYAAAVALVYGVVWNFGTLYTDAQIEAARSADSVVQMEERYRTIHWWLKDLHYSGDIEHATARNFRGEKRTEMDEINYVHLRYVTVPLNLVIYPSNAPWILGDFTSGEPVPEPPPGIVKVYDPGTGLVLYKREPQE